MDILCTADMCPVILNSTCVFYEGNNLTYTGINTNDSLQTALQKIDAKFGNAMVGYIFTNGVVQLSPGQPVKLGGSLIENTTIGGNFTLSFVGPIIGSKLATAGGTASEFLKGDGTLDNTPYQVAGAYITNLSGDVVASGPGTAVATLASVNANPGTYGDGTHVPRITVDSKGRITAVTSTAISLPSSVLSFTGDVYGSGSTGSTTTLTLNDVNLNVYNSNTFLKFKVNAKGLVTGATPVTGLDINSALGFTPVTQARTLTINGVTYDLSANRSWTVSGGGGTGTVTSVGATAGTGISVSVANPTTTPNITITNTAPDRIVSLTAGSNVTITGTYPNFTISSSGGGGGGGSVNSVTASAPLASSGGANPNITISQASTSTDGYLSSTDWNTFNGKQAAGSYITDLTGEASASGPGSATVTLSNSAVTGKVLTGVNITGGTVVATDTILEAFGKVQNQINGLIGGSIYKGTWDAATNTPTITSGVGTTGWYYIVSVPGSTNIDGITDWNLGDWIIFDGTAWQQVDNTDAVVSVNGQTGAVSLTTDNIPEGATNKYFTTSLARTSISLTTSGSAGAATYNNLTGVLNIPVYITTGAQTFAGSKTFSSTLFGAGAQFTGNVIVTGPVFQTDGPSTYIANGGNQNNQVYIAGSPLNSGFTRNVYIASNGNAGSSTNLYLGVNATGTTNNIYIGSTDATAVIAKGNWLFDDVLPISSTGGYSIPGGTSAQYLMADGSTSTGPSVTGYVPYTGATQNLNLGEYGVSAGYVGFDTTPTATPTTLGTMYWDTFYRTLSLVDGDGDTTLQIGQEERLLIHNNTGATLTDGQVVYVTGSTGELPSVSLADASSESTSAATLGVVTESILNGADGFVTVSGIVHGLNTLAYNEGDLLWLSETAGQFTNVKPISPAHLVLIGYVIKKSGGNGSILVKIQNTQELAESSDVLISAPEVDGQGLFLQTISGVQLWRNRTIADVLGYTPANAAITISTTAPLQGGGDLSANRTFSITQSTTSTDGYLSSTDWNTFNGKQAGSANLTSLATLAYVSESFVKMTGANTFALDTTVYYPASNPNGYTSNTGTVTSVAALTIGTAGTDISSSVANGTTTPVITLNIPTASATNRGALSAADWATFNSKQNAFTGTTNYIPKFTGTSTIGNSIMYNGAAGIGINTATPRASLDVVGNIYSNDIWIQDNYNLLFGDLTAGASSTYIYGVGGSGTNYLGFATNGSEAARILASRQLKLNAYTSTSSFTGTAAGYLAFDSSGNILSVAAPSGGVTGSGTTGYLTKFTGSTAVGNSLVSESGSIVTVGGYLTVRGAGTSSSIYMSDDDEGQRELHCNSNRIGFLTQAGGWGSWCNDDGSWNSASSMTCTSLTETSSERYKENIVTLNGSLDKVLKLRGVSYDRKDTKQKEIGVIAEEVEKIIPEVIKYNDDNQVDSVSYGRLTAILIEAIKEQQKQIDELKSLLGK